MSSLRMTTWFVGIENNGMYDMLNGTSAESNVHSIPEKDGNTPDNTLSNSTQPLSFYEITQREHSITTFIETYQNELPLLVTIKKGSLGETDSNSLDTDQVLRIHGVHSERRVLAQVIKDSSNCFGCGDVTLSIPVAFPIPMCYVKQSGSLKRAKTLKKIIKNHTLPVTVQLINTRGHDIKLAGKMVLLRGDVELKLLKEYKEKYIYGNPVKTGEVYRNVISVPSCEPNIMLSVITGLASHNNEHWQSTLELMDRTVTQYVKFDGKLCNTEIFDCSSTDLKKLVDETFTELGNKRFSGSKEEVLDEAFTQPGNTHSSGPKEKALDETFTEPYNKFHSGPKEEVLDEAFTEPEIFDCSSPDLKIEKLVDEIFTDLGNTYSPDPRENALDETSTEPDNKHSSGPKENVLDETFKEPGNKHYSGSIEKVLDETFTEPGNRHSSGPIEEILDEAFTEPGNKHSSSSKEEALDETFTKPENKYYSGLKEEVLDEAFTGPGSKHDHGYEGIPFDDSETKKPSSCQDCLLSGNNYCTIPLSQGHVLSNCKMVNMSKRNPDPGNIMHEEPISFYNQYEKDVSMGLPSTQKSEEMVAVGKPPAPTIRSPDIGGPCDIKIVKPVSSSFDIYSLSVQDLGQYLHILNIGQYAGKFSDAQIDGTLLKELDDAILVEEFGFKRFEALLLMRFGRQGYLPNTHKREEP